MTRPSSNSLPWSELLGVFLLGLLVRIALIHVHPAIYGGDAVARIMNADRVLLAYQLPLLQLLIYLVNRVSSDPLLIRYLMSTIGALAGAGFYLFSDTLLDRPAARLASLFFVLNPFLLVHSIVPYQEILMLLLLCLGLYCMLRPDRSSCPSGRALARHSMKRSVPPWTNGDLREVHEIEDPKKLPLTPSFSKEGKLHSQSSIGWASLFLGLACLTRYEAWVITAAAGLYYVRLQLSAHSSSGYWRSLAKTTALFGWSPLLWILLHRGVSPQGTYVLEGPVVWSRLWRIPYVTTMALVHAGPIVCVLAVLGLLSFRRLSLLKNPGIQMVLAAAVLLMLSLVFSAHGVAPDPQRYVTDREAHWFVLFPFWAAALGLSDLKHRRIPRTEASHPRSEATLTMRIGIYYLTMFLAVLWGVVQTDRYIKRLLIDQNLTLDYAVAQHLEKHLPPGSKALVFAKPLPRGATQEYFDKVYFQGGPEALDAARRQLAELNSGPLDYSRVAVNTRRRRQQILDASKLSVADSDAERFLSQNHVRLAAVFSNYPTQENSTHDLLDYVKQRGKPQITLEDRGLQVSIVEVLF